MNCTHTFHHYQECLDLALKRGYQFLRFQDQPRASNYEKVIYLRHDIDAYQELTTNATVVSSLEHDLHIPSTYFIRLHGQYNILHYPNFCAIQNLLKKEHELGLHLETEFSKLTAHSEKFIFLHDKDFLEVYFDIKIKSVSHHSYAKITQNDIELVDYSEHGILFNAYSDYFFKECKYISDSASRWREGCMCQWIQRDEPRLHILTHPIWWFYQSNLENF